MTRTTRHHIATVGILLLAASLALSAAGMAGSSAGAIPSTKLGEQPGQAQPGTTTQSNDTSNATVAIANQTTNGSAVTVKRAVLPEGGFVVLSSDPYEEIGVLEESMIAVSKPLSPGTHRNLTLNTSHSPPGGFQNQTALNTTSDYSVGLYRDGNNNSRFEYITTGGTNDTAYLPGTGTERRFVSDAALITIPGSNTPTPTASIRFANQSTNGSTVTVRSVTLPSGGFVVVHNQSYLRGGDPTQTAIGLSGYLPAGTHQNVSVALVNGSVQKSQTLVAVPSQDTDNNQTYDYVQSDGFRDVPYTANNGAVTDRAAVTVASNVTPTAIPSSAMPATATDTPRPATTSADTPRPATGDAEGSGGSTTEWLTANWIIVLVVIIVVGGYLLIRRS